MDEQETQEFDEDVEDTATFDQLDELEKLETLIDYMEELGIQTLEEARTRYATLEQAINSGQDEA
jgi:5,10-methenyltetrahydromethanopterin hydrogenase